jgi:hypothetical protein
MPAILPSAIKLRNDLFDYEDKLGSCRGFGETQEFGPEC